MLVDDICSYLAGAGLGLTVGTNLFKLPQPEMSTADPAVMLIEYGGRPAMRAMGPSIGDPVAEVTRFQVATITSLNGYQSGRNMIESVYQALDNLADTTIDGTRYLLIRALQPPFYMPPGEMGDPNAQHHFSVNFEAMKERG